MRKSKQFFIVVAAAIAAITINLQETRACTCLPPLPPAKAFADADAVFMGRVV